MNLRFEEATTIDKEPDEPEAVTLPPDLITQIEDVSHAQTAILTNLTHTITHNQANHTNKVLLLLRDQQDQLNRIEEQQQPKTILGLFLHWLIYGRHPEPAEGEES